MKPGITEQFNHFAGREVRVIETPGILPSGKKFSHAHVDDTDPVVRELMDETKKAGLALRILLPGQNADFGANPNRLTVHLEKDPIDDKYRIGRIGRM